MSKVGELSRRKLTEYFEAVTSFFHCSNVKTVYNLGDNDAKYRDAEMDDEHTRNSLASPLYIQEREASASLLQVYHSQRENLSQSAQSIFSKHGNPSTGCHKKRKSNQELDNCQFRIILGRQGNNCSQKQNPRSWDVNTERILPKIILVNWRDKLILKQWKLGTLEQGMNSPDENKLYFTKNWQIKNEHFVILVLEVFKSRKNWREIRYFDKEWSKII